MTSKPGSGTVLIVAILLFLILITAAVLVYPGGTVVEPHAEQFQFWQNFLSDLGRMETFAHGSNQASRRFFVPAIILVSAAVGWFFLGLFPLLILKSRQRFARTFLITIGVMALSRMGVGLTPWDRVGHLHLFCVQLTFFSGLMLGAMLLQESKEKGSIVADERPWLKIWVATQGLYLMLLVTGPFLNIESQAGLYIAAGSQKILLLIECGVMLRLGWSVEKRKRPGRIRDD
ncbi:MAG TPA: hypothetical protein VE954_12975 [Oligoflexus sp.]|uniref:hypothetical protein n=1 Tax=Oligoflexus sp. TaxID=1971216 RepID=UPI002D749581|nr:hypothetical protein [Oligoflexus sp.]HYX34022.1 hypothetical protein [Oligoflexus sp.]